MSKDQTADQQETLKSYITSDEINLPVDLLAWVAKDRVIKFSTLKTYLYIKLNFPDNFLLSIDLYKDIANGLEMDVKTAKTHVNLLLKAKFMGFDKKTARIWVWSKYKIIPKSKRKSKYHIKVSPSNFDYFTEFLLAATIAYMVRKQRQIARYRPALTNDCAFRSRSKAILKFFSGYPISLSYIGTFLGRSISWVDKYKQKAIKLKLITAKNEFFSTGIRWPERFKYMNHHGLALGRAKKYRGELFLIDTDILTSIVYVKKGKKV